MGFIVNIEKNHIFISCLDKEDCSFDFDLPETEIKNLTFEKLLKKFNVNLNKKIVFTLYIDNLNDLILYCNMIKKGKHNYNYNLTINCSDCNSIIKIIDSNLTFEQQKLLSIYYQSSSNETSYITYKDMVNRLVIEDIKKLNLTPLEQVLYVYDIAKEKVYNENFDDRDKARDLHEVMNGNNIVCVGYSNYMKFILDELGQDTGTIKVTRGSGHHMRNVIYLKDDIYNINNLFLLDVTWDSKNTHDDSDKYTFFLKPISLIQTLKEEVDSINYKIFEFKQNQVLDMIENDEDNTMCFLNMITILSHKNGASVGKYISILGNKSKLLQAYKEFYEYCNSSLTIDKFIKALCNVRRIQGKSIDYNTIYSNVLTRYSKEQIEEYNRIIRLLNMFGEKGETIESLIKGEVCKKKVLK